MYKKPHHKQKKTRMQFNGNNRTVRLMFLVAPQLLQYINIDISITKHNTMWSNKTKFDNC